MQTSLRFIRGFLLLLAFAPWTLSAAPAGPAISLSPALLAFNASEGGPTPADQTLTLSNSGSGHLDWNASTDRFWLDVTPKTGHLNAGQSITLTVRVTATPQAENWTPISTVNAPSAREDHYAAWTGTKMVVWGGELSGTPLNSGGIYDLASNAWVAATSMMNAPSPRTLHTLTWTGDRVIVWGGSTGISSGDTYYNQGYKFNPVTNQWTGTISTMNAPSARSFHTAVWTGSKMIVWGGFDGTQSLNTGGIYDPGQNKWVGTTSLVNAPAPRHHHAACWTGKEMIIWGGQGVTDGARYNPETNHWTPMTTTNAPPDRVAATAVWSGWEMIIWGGYDAGIVGSTNTGVRYNPTTDTWAATTSMDGTLSPRQGMSSVWTGNRMIITHGAQSGGGYHDDGAIYTPPVLPRGSHPGKVQVTAMGNLSKDAPVTLNVGLPAIPVLTVTGTTPAPGSTLSGAADSIVATLNESIDASSVDASSVKLLRAGPDQVFGTADDVVLNPAISVVGSNQIRVSLAGIPVLNQDVRLVLSGTTAAFAGRFGHWKLDEGTGLVAADSSGNGRVGLCENIQWVHGRVGYGLLFDGTSNRVNIDAGTIPPSWSAAVWVKREDSPNIEARILDCMENDAQGTSLRLEQFNPQDRVGFTTYGVEDYFFDYIAPVDTWTHLTFVGTSSGTSLYANGTLIGTHPASVSLFVGKIGTFSTNAMKGTIDEMQIYNRALTPAEVLSLARLDGAVRGTSGRVLDGEFGGSFPSGNGASGGDFNATYRR